MANYVAFIDLVPTLERFISSKNNILTEEKLQNVVALKYLWQYDLYKAVGYDDYEPWFHNNKLQINKVFGQYIYERNLHHKLNDLEYGRHGEFELALPWQFIMLLDTNTLNWSHYDVLSVN